MSVSLSVMLKVTGSPLLVLALSSTAVGGCWLTVTLIVALLDTSPLSSATV